MTRYPDRLPPLTHDAMDAAQQAAADELTAGPRKGVKGPFIALLRSPELLAAEPVGSRCIERAEKSRAHETDKEEVVEVSRL